MAEACTDCIHYSHHQDCDDHYITADWCECANRPSLANLKQFPFKKTSCVEFTKKDTP